MAPLQAAAAGADLALRCLAASCTAYWGGDMQQLQEPRRSSGTAGGWLAQTPCPHSNSLFEAFWSC